MGIKGKWRRVQCSMGVTGFICSHFENKFLRKPVHRGVTRTAHFIAGNEQTQLN